MLQADNIPIPIPPLPTTPRPIAQMVALNCYVPTIYHPGRKPEAARFERLPRKAKMTPDEALRYAQRRIYFAQLRSNDTRRRLAALSGDFWLDIVASMNLKQMAFHKPVNRDRTAYQGWGNR